MVRVAIAQVCRPSRLGPAAGDQQVAVRGVEDRRGERVAWSAVAVSGCVRVAIGWRGLASTGFAIVVDGVGDSDSLPVVGIMLG